MRFLRRWYWYIRGRWFWRLGPPVAKTHLMGFQEGIPGISDPPPWAKYRNTKPKENALKGSYFEGYFAGKRSMGYSGDD